MEENKWIGAIKKYKIISLLVNNMSAQIYSFFVRVKNSFYRMNCCIKAQKNTLELLYDKIKYNTFKMLSIL